MCVRVKKIGENDKRQNTTLLSYAQNVNGTRFTHSLDKTQYVIQMQVLISICVFSFKEQNFVQIK